MSLEELKAQVVSRAREVEFPGHIEFRRHMLLWDGQYDDGARPDVNPIVKGLRRGLPQHARGGPVIYLCYHKRTGEQILVTLAHELGHWEQPSVPLVMTTAEVISREAEANFKGFKYAVKWGVVPQFLDKERLVNEVFKKLGLPAIPPLGERKGIR